MRRRISSILLVSILALGVGGAALAAAPTGGLKKPARDKPPPVRAGAHDGLRESQPPAVVSVTRPAGLPSLGWPPPVALQRLGQNGTGLGAGGFAGLRAQTDGAPLCRTQCATVRYQCLAGEQSEACDGNWTRCVLSCRSPSSP